jgi:hypothetical protein
MSDGIRRRIAWHDYPICDSKYMNVEDVWAHSQPFDFIHIRNIRASIVDWKKLCVKSNQNLRSGG